MNSIQVRTLAAMAAMGSLLACGDSPGATLSDLTVTASISRPQFKSGDTTTVTTTIRNTGKHALLVAEKSCIAFFEVTRGDAVVAPGTPFCVLSATSPITLAGGESRTFREVWRGDNRAIQQPSIAGVYGLRGRVPTNLGIAVSTVTTINILP